MIVTLTGESSLALRQRMNELVNKFVAKHGELAVEKIDAEEAEAASIIESAQALPFLSAHKMVVVRNGSANSQFAERIEQTISSIPSSTDLILYEPQLDRRTVYFKLLKKQTQFEEFNNLDKAGLAKWLVAEAKSRDAKLGLADANYMVERLGENQELLYNELAKLAIYDTNISKANIDLLTEPTPQSKVFDLLDAAFSGKKTRALELYEDQRAQKVEPQIILSMIGWQLRLLTLIKSAGGLPPEKIAKDNSINSYPVKKAAGLAGKLSDGKLREMVSEALEIDIKSKTTPLDLDEALKTYIATL
ncbi:MAG TPA: DNA polymerase III subunit delta [Candidatus Saccharimonadales bacterium]